MGLEMPEMAKTLVKTMCAGCEYMGERTLIDACGMFLNNGKVNTFNTN
jgi:hypothetical protein